MYHNERHIGRAGDCFYVDSKAAKYSKQRAGHDKNNQNLQPGDVIMKTAHSGDCFCYYKVYRDQSCVGTWCGYEGVGSYTGNVLDNLQTLPRLDD